MRELSLGTRASRRASGLCHAPSHYSAPGEANQKTKKKKKKKKEWGRRRGDSLFRIPDQLPRVDNRLRALPEEDEVSRLETGVGPGRVLPVLVVRLVVGLVVPQVVGDVLVFFGGLVHACDFTVGIPLRDYR